MTAPALPKAALRAPSPNSDAANGAMEAMEWAPDPIAILAPDGALISANGAFRAAFRFAVTPQRPPWGRAKPPGFVDGSRQFDAAAPDGRVFEWRERVLPSGQRVACARDVTARSAEAAAAGRAKTALFATLTHELRTPLNGILGMAGLLARTPLGASQQEFVTALRRSGEHLLDLINEILDFSRLEAGRIVLDDAPFELGGVIQEIVELLSPKAHDKGLELVMRIAPGTPTALSGDAGRLRQVLFNLVGNAVKFTEAGGVAVFAQSGGPGRIVISVRDTGLGIAEDKQALIFEEFAQADVAHARMHGGTGLGLAIVRKLAATMGGTVSLASAPGAGATFSIDLPFAARAAPIAPTPLVGLRIALISANRVLLSEAAALLRDLGAQVQAATTLGRTIDADVILLDHAAGGEPPARLPQSAPVIVLAPQEERAAIAGYQTRGAQHYLLKPLRVRSLVEQIRSAVDRRPATMQSLRDEREMDPGADGALAGLKVLVADDNPINALLARTLLARAGCMVQVVCDGEEAVQAALAAEAPFDLILLDLRMPGVDGFAAARLIRASGGPAAATPLIALTADSAEEDRKAALAAGMDEFLTKPIDLARLMHAVAQFTRRPEAASAVR